jgi:hypothetical protein
MAKVVSRSMVVIQVGHQVRHGKERFATDRLSSRIAERVSSLGMLTSNGGAFSRTAGNRHGKPVG